MQLRPYKSPILGASRSQQKFMRSFVQGKLRVSTPQLGLNLGFDSTGQTTPTPPSSSQLQTFSGADLVTFAGDPIVSFS